MARDIFSREVTFGGSFAADSVKMKFTALRNGNVVTNNAASSDRPFDGGCDMMVQQFGWQYAQNISRLYELGCPRVYLVAGRTQGSLNLARIIGPTPFAITFYETFGDVCNAASNKLSFSGNLGCATVGGGNVSQMDFDHVIIQSIGGSTNAQDMLINETISAIYVAYKLSQDETAVPTSAFPPDTTAPVNFPPGQQPTTN